LSDRCHRPGETRPLGSSELLFQVMSDDLLLLPSEDGGALPRPCLIQGLACGSHSSDESPSTVERLELLLDIVSKMVVVRGGGGRRQALGLG
jgi:hypothetical protein